MRRRLCCGFALLIALALASTACSGFRKSADAAVEDGGSDAPLRDAASDRGAARDGGSVACSSLPLHKAGAPLGPSSTGSLTGATARGHGRIAVVWEDVAQQRSWLALLDEQGAVRVKAKLVPGASISPALAVSARGFVLLVHDLTRQDVVWFDVGSDGAVSGGKPLGVQLTSKGGYPALAARGDRYAVLYTAGDEPRTLELRFALLRADGSLAGSWRRLADTDDNTAIGDIVATDDGFAAAWIDEREGQQRIFAARLDAAGAKQAPGDLLVSAPGEAASFPDLAAHGRDLEICYAINAGPQGQGDIVCAHLAAGSDAPRARERLTDDPRVSSFQEVAWADGQFLVVWGDEQSGYGEIFGQLLEPGGARRGPIMRLTQNDATSGYPALVWLGDRAFVSWFQYRAASGWTYEYQIYPCAP